MKKVYVLSLLAMLLTLNFGSIGFAEDLNVSQSGISPAACTSYSTDRNNLIANNSNIVDNGNGTATVTFSTYVNCMQVSFSSYAYPAGVTPAYTGAPYATQIHFDGETVKYSTAGSYTLTIDIPVCAPYQLDLYVGPLQTHLQVNGHLAGTNKASKLKLTSTEANPALCQVATPTPTATPVATPSATPVATPVATPTAKPVATPTATPVATPTATPVATPTPTATPVATPTATPVATTLDDDPVPAGTIDTPDDENGSPGQPVPTASPQNSPAPGEIITVDDEPVPLGVLPQTGESSSMPYYVAGLALVIIGATWIRRRRRN